MPTNAKKMAEMGLTIAMEEVFREGSFVVVQLQVQHVDATAIERGQREETADLTQSDGNTDSHTTFAGALL